MSKTVQHYLYRICIILLMGVMFVWGGHFGAKRTAGHNLLQTASANNAISIPPVAMASMKLRSGSTTDGNHYANDDDIDDENSDSPGAIFEDVYTLLETNYVDTLPTDRQFGHAAVTAMLASLQDPNSRFLKQADMTELINESQGKYSGIGAVLSLQTYIHPKLGSQPSYPELRLTVVSPLPDSPAEKAGLIPGDYITAINGQWIMTFDPALAEFKALSSAKNDPIIFNKLVSAIQKKEAGAIKIEDAQSLLSTSAAKQLTITVVRPGAAHPFTIKLDISTPTVITPITSKMLPNNIGYIKINQFTEGADNQFSEALNSLNGGNLKGLVIDLRDCPGGLIDVGKSIAEQVSSAHSIGVLEVKGKHESPLSLTPAETIHCPVSVLVNKGTANTAELLAATLQQQGDKVLGTSTFGDAADVRPITLRDGSGFTMTVGQLLTADNVQFASKGIRPNILVASAPNADAPLTRALGMMSGQVAFK